MKLFLAFLEELPDSDYFKNVGDHTLIHDPSGDEMVPVARKAAPVLTPEPAGPLEIQDISCNSVQVSWEPSPSNADWVHYVVQYKMVVAKGSSKWTNHLHRRRISSCCVKVVELIPETEYIFRVISMIEKKRGRSSPISQVVKTKPLPGEFYNRMVIN